MTRLRFFTGWLTVALSCSATVACTAPLAEAPAAPAAEQSDRDPSPALVVFAEESGDSTDYSVVMIRGSDSALAGRTLDVFAAAGDGRLSQQLNVTAYFPEDDLSGCTAPPRIRPSPTDLRLPDGGALLANIDINPNFRFSGREAEAAESEAVLAAVMQGLSDVPPPLRDLQASNDAVTTRVIADTNQPGAGLAVLAIDLPAPASGEDEAGESSVIRWFAMLEGSANSGWHRVLLERGEGCSDCDSEPVRTTLRAFGDFDQDGLLDLLMDDRHYEGWSYRVISKPAGKWLSQPPLGGWGC